MTVVTKRRLKRRKIIGIPPFTAFFLLVVSYDTSLFNGFHFGEKLGKILFEGVLLDGF